MHETNRERRQSLLDQQQRLSPVPKDLALHRSPKASPGSVPFSPRSAPRDEALCVVLKRSMRPGFAGVDNVISTTIRNA
jgi:hypothetical protein